MEMRHNGQFYKINPWALTWDDENHYLVGYDAQAEKIKHYRVDKMRKLSIMEEKREGREHFKQFNLASYAKKNFGMFGGEEVNVNVAISSQFFGWVFALGTGVKILAPENVVERMKQEIDALHDFYNK